VPRPFGQLDGKNEYFIIWRLQIRYFSHKGCCRELKCWFTDVNRNEYLLTQRRRGWNVIKLVIFSTLRRCTIHPRKGTQKFKTQFERCFQLHIRENNRPRARSTKVETFFHNFSDVKITRRHPSTSKPASCAFQPSVSITLHPTEVVTHHFISSTCRFSLRPSPARRSLLRSSLETPSIRSSRRSKIRKASLRINSV
jgi:hypothetical protein